MTSLALKNTALMKKTWRWIMEKEIIYRIIGGITMGGYNKKLKIAFLGKMMQVSIYEEL